MSKKTVINVRIDAETKQAAQKIFRMLGISMSQGINLFLQQVIQCHGLPFAVQLSTQAAMYAAADPTGNRTMADMDQVNDTINAPHVRLNPTDPTRPADK